jgi:hypothetical protein
MVRARNRSPAARRDPRRLDAAGRQERGDADLREAVDREVAEFFERILWGPFLERDTRIALRRKLNGDTR